MKDNINIVNIIARTPNLECPACYEKRIHKKVEWERYHPRAGQGVDNRNNRDNTRIKKVNIK
jgi:hypothetical protein